MVKNLVPQVGALGPEWDLALQGSQPPSLARAPVHQPQQVAAAQHGHFSVLSIVTIDRRGFRSLDLKLTT